MSVDLAGSERLFRMLVTGTVEAIDESLFFLFLLCIIQSELIPVK